MTYTTLFSTLETTGDVAAHGDVAAQRLYGGFRAAALLLSGLLCFAAPLVAQPAATPAQRSFAERLGFSAHASTIGFGASAHANVTPRLNVLVTGSFFNYAQNDYVVTLEDQDLTLDGDARLLSFGLLADVLPFKRYLRLRAGLLYNANRISGSGGLVEGYTVGAVTFTPEELGTLSAEMDFSPLSGYLGLGLGNPVAEGKRLGFMLDVGAVYHGSPRFEMEGTGMVAPTAEQDVDVEQNLSGYQWLPAVGLGLSYKPF